VERNNISPAIVEVVSAHPRAGRACASIGFPAFTYLKVVIGSLLVLLGHSRRSATGEEAGSAEDNTSGTESSHDVHEDLHVLAWRCLSTGTVRAESDPVGWKKVSVSRSI
jgi:hypothetical protein